MVYPIISWGSIISLSRSPQKKMYIECATQVNGFKITFKYNLRCLKVGNNIFSTQEYNQFITLHTLRHTNLYFKAFQILIIKY